MALAQYSLVAAAVLVRGQLSIHVPRALPAPAVDGTLLSVPPSAPQDQPGQKMLLAVGNLTGRVELQITQAVTYLQDQMSHKIERTDSSVSSYNKALADDATQLQYSPMKAVLSSFASMAVRERSGSSTV